MEAADPGVEIEKAIYRAAGGLGCSKMARTLKSEMVRKAEAKTGGVARRDGGPDYQRRMREQGIAAAKGKVVLSGVAVAAGGGGEVKKKTRYKPGVAALREIRKYQRNTDLILRTRPFWRLVRERGEWVRSERLPSLVEGVRYKREALDVLKELTEAWVVTVLEDANLLALHRGVTGVQPKDLGLVFRMRHQTPSDWQREWLERK